jgi:hypothetical protein
VNKDVSARLLTHFYPPTENNDVSKNRFERQSLKATLVGAVEGSTRARIDGGLRMQHSFYHKADDKMVEATVVGFIDFEPASRTIRSFQLVTDQATYGGGTFGVAVRSLSRDRTKLAAELSVVSSGFGPCKTFRDPFSFLSCRADRRDSAPLLEHNRGRPTPPTFHAEKLVEMDAASMQPPLTINVRARSGG